MTNIATSFQQSGLSVHIEPSLVATNAPQFYHDIIHVPPGSTLTSQALGGYDTASFSVFGTRDSLQVWQEQALGCDVIFSGSGLVTAWNGMINQIDLVSGSLTATVGPLLTEVSNYVNLAYGTTDTTCDPPAVGIRDTTGWTGNADSQARFGIIERMLSGSGMTPTEAVQSRDSYLAERAWPKTLEKWSGSAQARLDIKCVGYWHWLKHYVFIDTVSTGDVNLSTKLASVIDADPNGLFSSLRGTLTTNTVQVQAYDNKDRYAWSIIKNLVAMGDANDRRHTFGVYNDREIQYVPAPTDITYEYRLARSGIRLNLASGAPVQPWAVRPGNWLFFIDQHIGRSVPTSPNRDDSRFLFAESTQYTAPYGIAVNGGRLETLAQALAKKGLAGIGG